MNNIYIYPDGTSSMHEPSDGQIFVEWDANQKVKKIWQWDGHKQQWFDVTVSGSSVPFNGIASTSSKNGDALQKEIPIKKCECGSEKCGFYTHSSWCPKYQT